MATRGQNFDLLFLEMMSAHHQGAIEMANGELRQFERWQQGWAAAPVR